MALLDDLLPKFDKLALSLEIDTLLHPVVIHFLMALPVVVLLLELMNMMMKKKAVGGVSFFLILLTMVAAVGAFVTGVTDGQDAAFTDAAKTALGDHKLLGTYLMLGSALVLLLKLLSMTGNKILKGLYLLSLIGFIVVMFKQGNDGGALVYKHGLNVQAVTTLDDKVFDLEEALEDAKAKIVLPEVQVEEVELPVPAVVPQVETTVEEVATPKTPVETTGIETVGTAVEVETSNTPVATPAQESMSVPVNVEEVVVIPDTQEIPVPSAQ